MSGTHKNDDDDRRIQAIIEGKDPLFKEFHVMWEMDPDINLDTTNEGTLVKLFPRGDPQYLEMVNELYPHGMALEYGKSCNDINMDSVSKEINKYILIQRAKKKN